MAIISNCELWFAKVNPKRPNNKFNKKNPTWEVQIRTEDKAVKKQWEELSLPVKAVVPDEGNPYFRVNLRKKSIKEDGEKASPIKVVDGKLQDVDPDSIGNGSVGNVRIFQYPFTREDGSKGSASVLMGIQLTKHIVYKAAPRDDIFEETDTEVVQKEPAEDEDETTTSNNDDDDDVGF